MLNFIIYWDEDGNYRWRVAGENGKTQARSALGYPTRGKCLENVRTFIDNIKQHQCVINHKTGKG